jgi:hypothetical protein
MKQTLDDVTNYHKQKVKEIHKQKAKLSEAVQDNILIFVLESLCKLQINS